MSETDDLLPSAPTIADAAEALAEHVDVRSIPRPPAFQIRSLLDDIVASHPNRERPPAPVIELVAPHWNEAVRLLSEPQGYLALTTMRAHLAARVQQAESLLAPYETSEAHLERIEEVVVGEAEKYGADATVGDHLDGRHVVQVGRGWRWVKEADHAYRLELARHKADPFWRDSGRAARRAGEAFTHETWSGVVRRIRGMKDFTAQRRQPYRREVALLSFRLAVVDQVLREHETLGHVGELKPGDPRRVERDIPDRYRGLRQVGYRLLLVLLAHEAIRTDPDRHLSLNALLAGPNSNAGGVDLEAQRVIKEFGLDLEENKKTTWGQGKAKYYATQPPVEAYLDKDVLRKQKGYENATREDRRRYFDERIAELYAELSDAGFSTVSDLVDHYGAIGPRGDM